MKITKKVKKHKNQKTRRLPIHKHIFIKNLGYYISKILLENNINMFFGVPSDLNMPLIDSLSQYVTFIPCRNELNASYISEGFARTNRFCLLVVGGLVGSLSAMNGMGNSISEKNPIFMIIGGNNFNDEFQGKLSHHTLFKDNNDQIKPYLCFRTLCGEDNTFQIVNKESLNTQEMISLFDKVSNSLVNFTATTLQIPVNIQKIKTHMDDFTQLVSTKFNTKISTYEEVTFFYVVNNWLNKLFNSDYQKIKKLKPVFLIGSASIQYLKYIELADERFYKLIDEIGAVLFYTIDAKGILDETNPNVIGYYWGGITADYKLNYFRNTDALFYLDVEFSDYTTAGYTSLFKPNYELNCKNTSVKNMTNKKLSNKIHLDKTSRTIVNALENNIHENIDIFVETGSSWFYGCELKLPKGCRYNISIRYGSIGWCFPSSIGNAFANPNRKTLCLTGDGALQMVIQEISTAVKHNVNLTVVLINNDMYQIENVLDDEPYNTLPVFDYEKIARSMGCKDVVSCDVSSFNRELEKHINMKGFNMIVLTVSKHEIDDIMKNWAILQAQYNTGYI
jgi:pyruvate decarboxylase